MGTGAHSCVSLTLVYFTLLWQTTCSLADYIDNMSEGEEDYQEQFVSLPWMTPDEDDNDNDGEELIVEKSFSNLHLQATMPGPIYGDPECGEYMHTHTLPGCHTWVYHGLY